MSSRQAARYLFLPFGLALFGALVAILGGCRATAESNPFVPVGYDEQTAALVASVPAGVVDVDEVLLVRLVDAAESAGEPGTPAPVTLTVNPAVRFDATWVDERTISFAPRRNLDAATTYDGQIDLSGLGVSGAVSKVPVRFVTHGPQIVGHDGRFVVADTGYTYEARFAFATAVPTDDLSKAFRGFVDGESVSAEAWSETLAGSPTDRPRLLVRRGDDERTLVAQLGPLTRTDDAYPVRIVPIAAALGVESAPEVSATVEPVGTFALVNVVTVDEPGTTALRLDFSDEPAQYQDTTGLITIEPAVETRMVRDGTSLYYYGSYEPGTKYRVEVKRGLESREGRRVQRAEEREVEAADMKPEVAFLHDGVFLPDSGSRSIFVETTNLRRVRIEVKRVFENNLGQFLQTELLSGAADRSEEFTAFYVERVGVTVATQTLEIGEYENRRLVHEIDLAPLIPEADKALYLLSISFERDDMIWDMSGTVSYYGDAYYSDPRSYGYLYAHGRVFKPIVASNLGLTWKAADNGNHVYVTDVRTAAPVAGAYVELRSYQNQVLGSGRTDAEGIVRLPPTAESAFFVTAETENARSVIKAGEMEWNLSNFAVGGSTDDREDTRIFGYLDRGVYRPGDTVHLSAIVRDNQDGFPEGHPVSMTVYNPFDQRYLERVSTDGVDGFYSFTVETAESDPSGTYRAVLTAGQATRTVPIRIETIVPNRLRVNIATSPERVGPDDRSLRVEVASEYLFGAPAAQLRAEVDASYEPRAFTTERFPGFTFSDAGRPFLPQTDALYRGLLSDEGLATSTWAVRQGTNVPSAAQVRLTARVLEEGGRSTTGTTVVPIDPYDHYVGLSAPDLRWGYAQIGSAMSVPVISVDGTGQAVAGRDLTWRLYRSDSYWWWEYDSYEEFQARVRSDSETEVVASGRQVSRRTPVSIEVEPERWGMHVLEVQDTESGHVTSFYFRASRWGDPSGAGEDATLILEPDAEEYRPGDTARITTITPESGRLLVTIEQGSQIRDEYWVDVEPGETTIEVPISAEMVPGVYVTASLLQPHARTDNDAPMRLYGVVPLAVYDPDTRLNVDVDVAETLTPGEEFEVTIRTDGKATFTVAVVDEGLLDLTSFRTPDPWDFFFAKQRLGVRSFDMYSQVLGAPVEDVFRVFSIGGGDPSEPIGSRDEDRRFEPVALYQGPTETDQDGRATVRFTMPNYLGSVRVMVVAADGSRYGAEDTAVPVRGDVVILPTLPRVLRPSEEFTLPVSVFAPSRDLGRVTVGIEATGPIEIAGTARQSVQLAQNDQEDIAFDLETAAAVGRGTVRITAAAAGVSYVTEVPLEVLPASPPMDRRETLRVEVGESVTLTAPTDGLPGSNQASVSILAHPDINVLSRLSWLVRYPYGCIEQTISAVLPQLALFELLVDQGLTDEDRVEIEQSMDDNIRAAIDRLRAFQLADGSFSYWPGLSTPDLWGTNYAGHFLLEARRRGYAIPEGMLDRWAAYQTSAAVQGRDDMRTRINRLLLLAKAGQPALGSMNLIRENHLSGLANDERWMLAAAYELAGLSSTAQTILLRAGTSVDDYTELSGTWGSYLRDRAIILDAAIILNRGGVADEVFEGIAESLSSNVWYGTQTTGYALTAAGHYLASLGSDRTASLSGYVSLPSGRRIPFDRGSRSLTIELSEHLYPTEATRGLPVTVHVESAPTDRVWAALDWSGQPIRALGEGVREGIEVYVDWYNTDGREINPRRLQQGEEFWAVVHVERYDGRTRLDDIAVSLTLPTGWETSSAALLSGENPAWLRDAGVFRRYEEYRDVRDDRVDWFFDLASWRTSYAFPIRLQAVTVGRFVLPPVQAQTMYSDEYVGRTDGIMVEVVE